MDFFQRNKLLFLVLFVGTTQFLFSVLTIQKINTEIPSFFIDSPEYISTSKFFLGEAEHSPIVSKRLFSSVIPFLSAMLSGLMGLPSAYLFVNFIFLIICSVILYLYFRKTFGDEKYALIAVALFMTSMPIIVWVPAVLVDMGTYLGCAILLYYTSFPFHDKLKDFMARIFLYAFAVLLKPSLAAIVLFCVLYQFFIRKEFISVFISGVCSVLIVFSAYEMMNISVGSFFGFFPAGHRHWLLVISSFTFAYHILFILVFVGLKYFRKINLTFIKPPKDFFSINALYLLCAMAFFFNSAYVIRFAFLTYPVFLTVSLYGMAYFAKRTKSENKSLIYLTSIYMLSSNIAALVYKTRILENIGKELVGQSWWYMF